ncbi:hypothetical protein BDR03DRAFT_1028821 [Suillus americanus]|nr:hypothetical protein BDR03DRAFT_1028821 [Suillus americanus]
MLPAPTPPSCILPGTPDSTFHFPWPLVPAHAHTYTLMPPPFLHLAFTITLVHRMHNYGLLQPSAPSHCPVAQCAIPFALANSRHVVSPIGDEGDLKANLLEPSFDEDGDSGSDFALEKLSEDGPGDLQNDSEDLEVDEEEAEEAPKRGKNRTPTTNAGSRPISHLPSITGARPFHKPPPKSQFYF